MRVRAVPFIVQVKQWKYCMAMWMTADFVRSPWNGHRMDCQSLPSSSPSQP